jgi:hypothetical protein
MEKDQGNRFAIRMLNGNDCIIPSFQQSEQLAEMVNRKSGLKLFNIFSYRAIGDTDFYDCRDAI